MVLNCTSNHTVSSGYLALNLNLLAQRSARIKDRNLQKIADWLLLSVIN